MQIGGPLKYLLRIKYLKNIPLYSNAFYLMLSSLVNAALGFVFWFVATKLYSTETIGTASAIIAAIGLLSAFTGLGLGTGLVRFLPKSEGKSLRMINTVFTIGILASLLASGVFIIGLDFWSPALIFLKQTPFYYISFIFITIAQLLSYEADQVVIAGRRADYLFIINIIASLLRLFLVLLLSLFLRSFGVFISWGTSLIVACIINISFFLPKVQPNYRLFFTIERDAIRPMLKFSFASYIATFFWGTPTFLLPLIVVNLLGAQQNGYFTIAWQLSGALFLIPQAISISLFAEGSHEEQPLGPNIIQSLKMTYVFLFPTVILVVIMARYLLLLYGIKYSENSTILLQILVISTIPLAVNLLNLSILRIQKRNTALISISACVGFTAVGLTYLLIHPFGIIGVGISWLISQFVFAAITIVHWIKHRSLYRLE